MRMVVKGGVGVDPDSGTYIVHTIYARFEMFLCRAKWHTSCAGASQGFNLQRSAGNGGHLSWQQLLL